MFRDRRFLYRCDLSTERDVAPLIVVHKILDHAAEWRDADAARDERQFFLRIAGNVKSPAICPAMISFARASSQKCLLKVLGRIRKTLCRGENRFRGG